MNKIVREYVEAFIIVTLLQSAAVWFVLWEVSFPHAWDVAMRFMFLLCAVVVAGLFMAIRREVDGAAK